MMYQIQMLTLLFGVTRISATRRKTAGGWGTQTTDAGFSDTYINVDDLYYTHGDRNSGGKSKFRDGFLDLLFKKNDETQEYTLYTFRPTGTQHPVTMYNTIMDLLIGNPDLGVNEGILQRLITIGKTPLTVDQEELREALKATIDALKTSYDCTPEVVPGENIRSQGGIRGRMYSNNNRSLYVLQTVRTMFPRTTMMVPCRMIATMSGVHRASTINHINRMDRGGNPGMGVRFGYLDHQPAERRADINAIFTKDTADKESGFSVRRINADALRHHVYDKVDKVTKAKLMGRTTGGRFGRGKGKGKGKSRCAW